MTTSPLKVEEELKKFETWFKREFHPDKSGPYLKDMLREAWQARAQLDEPSTDLISTPQSVLDEKFIQHFGLKATVTEIRNLIDKQGGYDFEALHREQSDGK